MTTTRESKRIPIEKALATYYQNKFAQEAAKLLGLPQPKHEQSKRILSVIVTREVDTDGDTSCLGEYSNEPGDYAIVNRGEHEGEFVADLPCECGKLESEHKDVPEYIDIPDSDYQEKNPDWDSDECYEYDRVAVERGRSYRYFNPANIDSSIPDEEQRKYAMQDYERMRGLNNGQWCFIGVLAKAQVQLNGSLTQTISSGGLWSIESDSEESYFTEVEGEQLDELKRELHSIGFTKRAIAAAMRSVEHRDN